MKIDESYPKTRDEFEAMIKKFPRYLKKLTNYERDKNILENRFFGKETLAEIGTKYNLTPNTIRMIIKRFLYKTKGMDL